MSESESFEDLLNQFDQAHPQVSQGEPKVGDKVTGTLIAIGEEYAFVDLGAKSEGRLELSALKDAEGQLKHGVGDLIESHVTGKDEESGMLLLGSQHGHKYHGLEEVERAYRQGLPVQGQVTGAVKGGVEVQVAGMRAFCPASQVDIRFVEDLSEFVGQRLDFRVTKLEGGRRPNLVVSRRALLEEAQQRKAEETRATLKEGAVLTGTVSSLKDYGAFVDIGGLEGMIHISELAFGHVKHPKEILQVGQAVEVSVLRIEPPSDAKKREKIALSIRALSRDPWLDAIEAFPVGTRTQGKVVRLQPFGAFIELSPGVDGLAHISELGAEKRINHPSDILREGDLVEASVIGIDVERHRISLSLDETRAAESAAAETLKQAKSANGGAEKSMGSFGELLKETINKGR
ncbi:S1 RNA-binding domain-containing protein [Thiorhodococcus mannitoliphagus]|uniref:S1 RNA-binding domain-containing protein n=1 Tax=Thiorhodococcus mannitoliphagus TaxID=329406 RepID=A0A6P1DUI8_9GAMM|nr:S1 RNA-binding domain-containing protein [Thiorhodococcus mannitoliphagus]NEX21429.1 S1 RNA-binding domain-containing protein [Thiorhodococcus mannitoliphagus]